MAGQFKIIIEHFNNRRAQTSFTVSDLTRDIAAIKTDVEITKGTLSNFMTIGYRMGVMTREPVENRKYGGPKFIYTKVRGITPDEKKALTTRPQCFQFRKELDAAYKKKQLVEQPKASPAVITRKNKTKKKVTKDTVNIEATPGTKIIIAENSDKTVITIFK